MVMMVEHRHGDDDNDDDDMFAKENSKAQSRTTFLVHRARQLPIATAAVSN